MHIRNNHGKNLALEGLRGVAALLVLISHFALAPLSLPGMSMALDVPSKFIPEQTGILGVQLFFCITGYLFWEKIANNPHGFDWGEFYIKRFYRIVPAYLAASALILFVAAYMSRFTLADGGRVLFREIFGELSFGFSSPQSINGIPANQFNAVNWTLRYEWLFYMLLPIICVVRSRALIAGSAFLLLFVFVYYQPYYVILFFATGMISAERVRQKKHRPIIGSVVLIFCLALFMSMSFHDIARETYKLFLIPTVADDAPLLIQWILVSCAFLAVVSMSPMILTTRVLVWIGSISYSLYLFHLTILQLTIRALNRVEAVHLWTPSVYLAWILVAASSSLAVSAISYRFIEKPFLMMKKNKRPIPSELAINKSQAH